MITPHYIAKGSFSNKATFWNFRCSWNLRRHLSTRFSCYCLVTLCDPVDCSSPGSIVHGILQVRILDRVAISFSKESSWPRDQTCISCIAGRFCTVWAIREAQSGFTDYAKAFDCVDHNKLWKILKEMGIPDHLTCLLRNLYAGQEATVVGTWPEPWQARQATLGLSLRFL